MRRQRFYSSVVMNESPRATAFTTTSRIVSMVWSGADDWQNSTADIVALSSVLPDTLAAYNLKNPVFQVTNHMTPALAKKIPGVVTISIGGSSAGDSEWQSMASGGVTAWTSFFTNLFNTTGVHGLDWDLENISTPSVYDFIGQLSQQLKKVDPTYVITYTVFGNISKQPPLSFYNNYLNGCDYVVFMLYNGGPYNATVSGSGSWCDYLDQSLNVLPAAVRTKFLYATYPNGGTVSGCGPLIQQMVDYIRAGKGAGVAFWCYGGWNGVCKNGMSTIDAWVKILNQGGGTGVQQLNVAFPGCTGPFASSGCGYIPNTQYSCINNTCIPNNNSTTAPLYPDSTCGGNCSSGGGGGGGGGGGTAKFGCVNGTCQQDPNGTYPDSTCNNSCTSQATKYACIAGECKASTNGTYPTKDCGNMCSAGTSKFSCDAGVCKPDPTNGTYPDSTCNNACGAPPPCASLGIQVGSLTGAACKDPKTQFTCNGTARCCCPGTIPNPSSQNPTACLTPTAAVSATWAPMSNYGWY